MVIDNWMLVLSILMFGACAYTSYRGGMNNGITIGMNAMLHKLYSQGIILVSADGNVIPGKLKKIKTVK